MTATMNESRYQPRVHHADRASAWMLNRAALAVHALAGLMQQHAARRAARRMARLDEVTYAAELLARYGKLD